MIRQESIGRTPGSVEDMKKFLKYNRFWQGVDTQKKSRKISVTQDSIVEKQYSLGVFSSGGDACGKN